MSEIARLGWRVCNGQRSGNKIFRRSLGTAELLVYWDTAFNGVSTTIGHMVLEADAKFEHDLFSKENIELAWLRMKQRFPLLAASVEELPGSDTIEFVLDETSLSCIRPGEVNLLGDLESVEDVIRLTDRFQNGQPVLTNEIIAQLWIGPQKDTPREYHVFIVIAHHITDGITGATLMRELCQELASLSKKNRVLGKSLDERLASLIPVEALNPNSKLSRPRRRWRSAVAKVMHNLRQAKLQGGQTLPTIRPVDPRPPVVSRTVVLRLSSSQTRQVIDGCRALGVTFGNALPVLSQLAQARLLYRCRRRRWPAINDEEWQYRRVQPMHFSGPINLRPYLDREWYDAGGASEVRMAIGSYNVVLPFMPWPKFTYQGFPRAYFLQHKPQSVARWLEGPRDVNCFLEDDPKDGIGEPYEVCEARHTPKDFSMLASIFNDEDEVPPFSSFLSRERFVNRAHMVRAQSAALLRHPLLLELQEALMQELCQRTRAVGLAWRAKLFGRPVAQGRDIGKVLSPVSERRRHVVSNGGASMGDRDQLLPLDYPLQSGPSSHKHRPLLHVVDCIVHMRCRPGELYLGALTSQGQMTFFSYVDANVYDLDLVYEWVEDVRAATLHYLGHRSDGAAVGVCAGGGASRMDGDNLRGAKL